MKAVLRGNRRYDGDLSILSRLLLYRCKPVDAAIQIPQAIILPRKRRIPKVKLQQLLLPISWRFFVSCGTEWGKNIKFLDCGVCLCHGFQEGFSCGNCRKGGDAARGKVGGHVVVLDGLDERGGRRRRRR